MGSVVALSALIAAAYVAVLAGGIAFEITGMDRDMARFQALSAFTGTGFTTRASEAIVEHRTRRRIAMVLIVLGYAGAASVIATLISSLNMDSMMKSLESVGLLALTGGVTLLVMRRYKDTLLTRIRRSLGRRLGGLEVAQENLFRAGPGIGVARIEIPEGCPLISRPLSELDLRAVQLSVLMLERPDHAFEVASGTTVLSVGDHVLIFGRLNSIQATFAPQPLLTDEAPA